MNTTWSATSRAKPISWVTTIIVMPSLASPRMTSSTSLTSSGSSALVTSSNSISFGSIASARAIATRCCWPPESRAGVGVELVGEADPLEQLRRPLGPLPACALDLDRLALAITFSSAVMCGKRLKRWKTIPISARLRATSDSRSSCSLSPTWR